MTDKKLSLRLYLTEFFGEMIPIYALVPLLFAEYVNFDALKVGILLAFWQIMTVMFEVPTGIVADRFGRKASMLLGKFIRIIGFATWLVMPNFNGLLMGVIVLSLGDALLSGSTEAYTYDEIHDKKIFNKIRQRTVAIHLAAFTGAGLMAYLLDANFESILAASVIISAIGFVTALLLPKDKVRGSHETFRSIVSTSRREFRDNSSVTIYFVRASVIFALMIVGIEQINAFYSDAGYGNDTVALIMTFGNLLTFGLLWTAHLYEKWTRKYQHLLFALLLVAFGTGVYMVDNPIYQVAMIFLFVRMTRIANMNASVDLHDHVGPAARATIGSLVSFAAKILAAVAMIAVGLLARSSGDIRKPLFLVMAVLTICSFGAYVAKTKYSRASLS